MSRIPDIQKNQKIKESYLATKAKRANQVCKVFTTKIQYNKLNNSQKELLKMMFVEAKWLYNYILNLSKDETIDFFNLKYNDITEITRYDKDKNLLTSPLRYLCAQMRQCVLDGVFTNIRALNKSKQKGNKIGALKFLSEFNSINLKQPGISYKIVGNNKIKVQGISKPMKVNGLGQILTLSDYDLANAKILKKADGYFIAITVYLNKTEQPKPTELMGVDFGCQTSLTFSDGTKVHCAVAESERTKRLKRKLSKSKKGSKNRWKLRQNIRKLNEKTNHIKNDAAHKVCHDVLSRYKVVMQDEQLSNWQKTGHGRATTNGFLGRVKTILMNDPNTEVLSKWVPTSKLCRDCGHKVPLKLWDREFICPECGCTGDRDIHAAENMVWFYKNIIGVGRIEFKSEDFKHALAEHFEGEIREATESSVQW